MYDYENSPQIVGYQGSYDSSTQVLPEMEGYSDGDTLYAIPLPPALQDRRAWWTESGWCWF